jgi:hypothetical protein
MTSGQVQALPGTPSSCGTTAVSPRSQTRRAKFRDVRGDTGNLAHHENGWAAAATKHIVPRALPGETRSLEIVQIVFGHTAGL